MEKQKIFSFFRKIGSSSLSTFVRLHFDDVDFGIACEDSHKLHVYCNVNNFSSFWNNFAVGHFVSRVIFFAVIDYVNHLRQVRIHNIVVNGDLTRCCLSGPLCSFADRLFPMRNR